MNEISEELWTIAALFSEELWRRASYLPGAFRKSLRVSAREAPFGLVISVYSVAPFARAYEFGVGRYPIYPVRRKALGFSRWNPKNRRIRSRKYIGPGLKHQFLFRWVEFPGRTGNRWLYNLISAAMQYVSNLILLDIGVAFFKYTIRRVNTDV